MRILILVALLCTTTALVASVEASKKSFRTLPLDDHVPLRTKKKSSSIPDSVVLDAGMEPVERILELPNEENDGDHSEADTDLETAVHKRQLRRRRRRKNHGKKAKKAKKKGKNMAKKKARKIRKARKRVKGGLKKKLNKVKNKAFKRTKKRRKTNHRRNPKHKKRRRHRHRRRRRIPVKKPNPPSTAPPKKLPPKVPPKIPTKNPPTLPPNPDLKECPCRVVAKQDLKCYSFTNEAKGICKLRYCEPKWECVANGRPSHICIRKFATEVIEPRPGNYKKCRRRKHRPKPYWVFYREIKPEVYYTQDQKA